MIAINESVEERERQTKIFYILEATSDFIFFICPISSQIIFSLYV